MATTLGCGKANADEFAPVIYGMISLADEVEEPMGRIMVLPTNQPQPICSPVIGQRECWSCMPTWPTSFQELASNRLSEIYFLVWVQTSSESFSEATLRASSELLTPVPHECVYEDETCYFGQFEVNIQLETAPNDCP